MDADDLLDQVDVVHQALKSEEEIAQATLSETLTDSERAFLLIGADVPVRQRRAVIEGLPSLVAELGSAFMNEMLPHLLSILREEQGLHQNELSAALACAFRQLVERRVVSKKTLVDHIVPVMFEMVSRTNPGPLPRAGVLDIFGSATAVACGRFSEVRSGSADPVATVAESIVGETWCGWTDAAPELVPFLAWRAALLGAIQAMPSSAIPGVVEAALSRVAFSEHPACRLVAAEVLGLVAGKMKAKAAAGTLLEPVIGLCQDTDVNMRLVMCQQLARIACAVGQAAAAESLVSTELAELCDDEHSLVRAEARRAIAELLEAGILDPETVRATVVPLVIGCVEEAASGCGGGAVSADPAAVRHAEITAELMGRLLASLAPCLEREQGEMARYLAAYRALAGAHRVGIRVWCARNFPVIWDVAWRFLGGDMGAWAPVHEALCRDPEERVRASMAAGLHVVMGAAKPRMSASLTAQFRQLFVAFLRDPEPEPRKAIVAYLDDTLAGFKCAPSSFSYADLAGHVVRVFEAMPAVQWRQRATMLEQWAHIPRYFEPKVVHARFTPLLFDVVLRNEARPVQAAAVHLLCTFMRHVPRAEVRETIRTRILEDLGGGASYWHRLHFVHLCRVVLGMYSRAFCKRFFFEPLLKMCVDPVSNVRLAAVAMLPDLKRILRLPMDTYLHNKLEEIAAGLASDPDPDVEARVATITRRLAQIKLVAVRSGATPQFEEDLIDKKREEEEDLIASMEAGNSNPTIAAPAGTGSASSRLPRSGSSTGRISSGSRSRAHATKGSLSRSFSSTSALSSSSSASSAARGGRRRASSTSRRRPSSNRRDAASTTTTTTTTNTHRRGSSTRRTTSRR